MLCIHQGRIVLENHLKQELYRDLELDNSRLSSLKQDFFTSCIVCTFPPLYHNGIFFDKNKNALFDNRGHIDIKAIAIIVLRITIPHPKDTPQQHLNLEQYI